MSEAGSKRKKKSRHLRERQKPMDRGVMGNVRDREEAAEKGNN